ncbi:TniQ protein [Celeribacter baekdonensis]|uniref:TniQ protein n=2 Tax=Celeribacter baekdonensis TaxID=875171 RepID=A0A1G7S159_9RHOB|nr:TniQ family protein [Celeribacter baekdonensis]SDG16746.1 TniQ protein [Celeribacter baekdonensis]
MRFYEFPTVFRSPLYEGETPASYVSRLAALHRTPPRDFCSDLGMRWPFLCTGHEDQIAQLAWLVGLPAAQLQRWSARKLSIGRYQVGRTHSSTGVFRRTATRLCPVCAEETLSATGPHGVAQRLEWSVLSLHRCETHGCALITLPPAPHAHLPYDVVAQARQHQGRIRDAAKSPMFLEPTAFEAYVRERIYEGPQADWLQALDLTNLHRASLTLGAALEGLPAREVALMGRGDERSLCQAGFERLCVGAEALTGALDRLRAQSTAERPYFSADLRPFYHWLRSVYDDPSLTKITALTREHIFKTYPVDLDQYVLGEKPTNEVWLTMEDARARSGFGAVFLKKLLGHMQGVSEVEALMRTDVHVDELRDAKVFWATLTNLKEAADALAISPSQVKVLMSLGVLPSIQITSSLRYTKRDAVRKLLKAIEELPPVSAEGGFLPVRAFCRRDGIALPKVIKAFCERTLSGDVRRGQGPGLHALHIEFDAMKSERDISLSQDITLPEAATYLRINIISIRKLRDAGYLKQIQKRNPDTNHVKSYLTLESIRAFERRWITLGQMAEVEGSEPYHLARKLDRDGAVPISCFTGFVRVYEREFS